MLVTEKRRVRTRTVAARVKMWPAGRIVNQEKTPEGRQENLAAAPARFEKQPNHRKHSVEKIVNLRAFGDRWLAQFGVSDHQVIADEIQFSCFDFQAVAKNRLCGGFV